MEKLVSILTPTYNCGKYIHRLLDSVLMQTYPAIEMYVIDDGSTDNTKEIIEQYIPKFQERGFDLFYIYQQNQGQSVAINNGLKLIRGAYLVWPDADDFYKTDDSIMTLFKALESTDDSFAMARCLVEYLNEDTLAVERVIETEQVFNTDLFEDCLYGNNGFWFLSGGYMADFEALKTVIPDLVIYTDKDAGQNWQLMLPILHKHKCVTIPEIKYSVISRKDSHSRGQYKGRKAINAKLNIYRDTIISTLDRIPSLNNEERVKYKANIKRKYKQLTAKNNFYFFIRRPIKLALNPILPIIKR